MWSGAVMWSDAVMWSGAVMCSGAVMWSGAVMSSGALMWSGAVMSSGAVTWICAVMSSVAIMRSGVVAVSRSNTVRGTYIDIVLHRVESGIVDRTLGERSLYSWLGAWRGWYAACTITVFGKTDLYCS